MKTSLVTCLGVVLSVGCGVSTVTSTGAAPQGSASQRVVSPDPIVEVEHDAVGNLTRVDAASFAYDPLDRLALSTDPLAGQTVLHYGATDAVVGLDDPRAVTTTYERDGFGDVTRQASGDTGETLRAYDEAGNLVSSLDARGVTTLYSYDALDRLTRATHQRAGAADEVFTWAYGDQLAATTFPGGGRDYTHDAHGQLTTATLHVGGVSLATRYEHDAAAGHVVAVTYPSGRRLDITWLADVPTALSVTRAGVKTSVIDQVSLDAAGSPHQWRWQGTLPYRRERDAVGRIAAYPIGAAQREVSYDARNRVVGYSHIDLATGASLSSLDETFTYDGLDRLVGFTRGGASHTLGYDATGNRTALDDTAWSVDPLSNRLAAETSDAGTRLYSFDPAGNVLGDGDFAATYDGAGRMASLTRAGVTTTYVYDGSGQRVRKLSANVDLRFVHDSGGRLLGEYGATGAAVREYVWLGDTLVAFFAGDELVFVHCDHLSAPRVAFDAQGRERWRWLASPFGDDAPGGDVELPLRFPGQYADTESGLFYNHHRYYQPATGRYTQSDPVGLEGGLNPYAYVEGNPVSAIDPDGLTAVGVAVGGVIRVVGGRAALGSLARAAARYGALARIGACLLAGACALNDEAEDQWVQQPPADSSDDGAQSRPPTGSRPISDSDWSGDHGGIKRPLGLRGDDDVHIDPNGNVWVKTPDGKWVDEGPADAYTGGSEASGRRGRDRDRKRNQRRDKRDWQHDWSDCE